MRCKIYLLTNKVNGKIYIGQTWGPLNRRMGKNGGNYKNSVYLFNAIQKHNSSNFEYTILAECETQEEADTTEVNFISKFDSANPKIGYNIDKGGRWNVDFAETRRKMSLSAKAHPSNNKGKKLSDEQKAKMSETSRLFSVAKSLEISVKYTNGKLIKELASEYNCSNTAIQTALTLTNTKRRISGWENAENHKNDIINYYVNSKMTAREIGKIFKCDRSDIANILKSSNIPMYQSGPTARLSPKVVDEIRRKSAAGIDNHALSREYNKGLTTIRKIVRGAY